MRVIFENTRLALEGLKSNKMRALLTMLGIIIGISSVITIVTVGNSITDSVSDAMQGMGATNIMVNVRGKDSMGAAQGGGSRAATMHESDLITDEMIDKYMQIHGSYIQAVSLSANGGSGKAQDGRLYANVTITGANEGYGISNNVEIIKGRFLRESDIKSKRYVAVVSDKFVSNMFPADEDPLAKEIKISTYDNLQTYTIIGVYKYDAGVLGMMGGGSTGEKDIRTNLYIPITTCNIITSADKGYSAITVMSTADADSQKFTQNTKDFFNTYYTNNARFEISVTSMESMMSSMTTMMSTMSIAIAIIAGISLLVGGIGVMNIMLVSVTERTREIGTRKALGAKNTAIRFQFIVESMIICGIGGIIGIITGVLLGYAGSSLLGFPGFPTAFIVIVAFLFSMLVGMFFGYYPANKAAKLDPIEALRYE